MGRPGTGPGPRAPTQTVRARRHEESRPTTDPDHPSTGPRRRAGRGGTRSAGRLRSRVLPRVGQSGRRRGGLRKEPGPALAARPLYRRPARAGPLFQPLRPRPAPRAPGRPRDPGDLARPAVARQPADHPRRGDRLPRHARLLATPVAPGAGQAEDRPGRRPGDHAHADTPRDEHPIAVRPAAGDPAARRDRRRRPRRDKFGAGRESVDANSRTSPEPKPNDRYPPRDHTRE